MVMNTMGQHVLLYPSPSPLYFPHIKSIPPPPVIYHHTMCQNITSRIVAPMNKNRKYNFYEATGTAAFQFTNSKRGIASNFAYFGCLFPFQIHILSPFQKCVVRLTSPIVFEKPFCVYETQYEFTPFDVLALGILFGLKGWDEENIDYKTIYSDVFLEVSWAPVVCVWCCLFWKTLFCWNSSSNMVFGIYFWDCLVYICVHVEQNMDRWY